MKRYPRGTARRRRPLRVWTLAQARSAVPYLTSVARSLRDTARFLDLLRPASDRAADTAPYSRALATRTGPLRIAFWTRPPDGSPVHPDCQRTVEATAARLAAELAMKRAKVASPPAEPA